MLKLNLKKLRFRNKITTRLIIYFLLTTLIMSLATIYTYNNTKLFLTKIDDMFSTSIELNALKG